MATDKVTEVLLEALKQALAEPGEQPLYRSGKKPGLFPSRGGVNELAATRAVEDGLLEIVREDVKGKIATSWVRPTPRAVKLVYEHESPVCVLQELQGVLQANRDGLPLWLGEIRGTLQKLVDQVNAEALRWTHILDSLNQRVDDAIRRAETPDKRAGENSNAATWSGDALTYLDRRRESGAVHDCPLPELFSAVREQHPDISLPGFHEGLRHLQERRAVSLIPFTGPPNQLTQPEFALLVGGEVLYYASR